MDNKTLSELIITIDPSAKWVYNNYCGYCGKFLHPEELEVRECRRCKSCSDAAIKKPIPFSTSGTAIEKLVIWLRDSYIANRDTPKGEVFDSIRRDTTNEYVAFMATSMDIIDYRENVIGIIGDALLKSKDVLCHT